MNINIYSTSDDKKVLNKSLVFIKSVNVKIKESCDKLNPILIMKKSNLEFNYIYIPDWGRYYFAQTPTYNKGIMSVQCNVDVLMSYRYSIKNLFALVNRQEFVFSPYVLDQMLLTRCDKTIVTQNVGVVGESTSGYKYYLCVNGGVE